MVSTGALSWQNDEPDVPVFDCNMVQTAAAAARQEAGDELSAPLGNSRP